MIEHLTKETFDLKVTNFSTSPGWKFEGQKPMIIKFSAPWCQPCKMLIPVIEEIDKEFSEKIEIYEVDTDSEMELPMVFNIRSVPTLVFFSIGKFPFIKVGAMPANVLKKIIEEELF